MIVEKIFIVRLEDDPAWWPLERDPSELKMLRSPTEIPTNHFSFRPFVALCIVFVRLLLYWTATLLGPRPAENSNLFLRGMCERWRCN